MLTVVILTLNEARHIARAIESVRPIASRIVVVDSGSADGTAEIASGLGADVLTHPFETHARQLNWALDQLGPDTGWVMRLDADEIVTPRLLDEIAERLPTIAGDVNGLTVRRRMAFLRRPIRHGGVFPIDTMRIVRHGMGHCEDRLMDEHIAVEGRTAALAGEILDDNLNSLTWWTDKHNAYASREVIEILRAEGAFGPSSASGAHRHDRATVRKRWVKRLFYDPLPLGARALAYAFYRYVIRLGFLDGAEGTAFHALQGFWYRYLVDAKLLEIRRAIQQDGLSPMEAVQRYLDVKGREPILPASETSPGSDGIEI